MAKKICRLCRYIHLWMRYSRKTTIIYLHNPQPNVTVHLKTYKSGLTKNMKNTKEKKPRAERMSEQGELQKKKKSHEVASPQHLSIKIEDSFFFYPEQEGENRRESTEGK